jgi:hypothetical protein
MTGVPTSKSILTVRCFLSKNENPRYLFTEAVNYLDGTLKRVIALAKLRGCS